MPKRFKFRLSGVIPTFCRPKHPSDLPSDPFLSFLRRHPPSIPKNATWHVFPDDDDDDPDLPRRKIYTSAASDNDEHKKHKPSAAPPPKHKRLRRLRKKTSRLSISSADSGLLFSDGNDDDNHQKLGAENETLVSNSNSNSSISFSTDSSTEFSPHLETIREGPTMRRPKNKKKKKKKKKAMKRWPGNEEEEGEEYVAARLSAVLQKMLVPCGGVEGKVRESLAVVKRSEEPYQDFRRSMVEMIVEKEMVEEADLRELLRCFLSLNSEEHHGIILRAFHDICSSLLI